MRLIEDFMTFFIHLLPCCQFQLKIIQITFSGKVQLLDIFPVRVLNLAELG
jgi:hypothetical protein